MLTTLLSSFLIISFDTTKAVEAITIIISILQMKKQNMYIFYVYYFEKIKWKVLPLNITEPHFLTLHTHWPLLFYTESKIT